MSWQGDRWWCRRMPRECSRWAQECYSKGTQSRWQRASLPVQSPFSRCGSVFDVPDSLVALAGRSSCWKTWCWWMGWNRWRLSRASGCKWGYIDCCRATLKLLCRRWSRTQRPHSDLSRSRRVVEYCSKLQRLWWLKHISWLGHMCKGLVHVVDDIRRHSVQVLSLVLSKPIGSWKEQRSWCVISFPNDKWSH